MQQWGRKPEKQEYNAPNGVAASFRKDCLTDKPAQDEIFAFSGVHAFRAGRFREAMAIFADAIELNPKNATAWLYVGMVHREIGSYDKSISCISESITFDSGNPMAYVERADSYYRKGDVASAKNDVVKALGLDPNYSDAYALLGNCRHDEGRHAEALLAFAKYCELTPDDVEGNRRYHEYRRHYLESIRPKKAAFTIQIFTPMQLPNGNWMIHPAQIVVGLTYGPRKDTNEV